jgi:creatinine amidohydrolase
MGEIRLQWMRPGEVLTEQERCSVVYLPIGPLEWHGPHLPLGVDPLHAESIAVGLAREVGGVVHPTLYWGTERERSADLLRDLGFSGHEWIVGMDFPRNSTRSHYYSEETLALIIRFMLEQLAIQGYRVIVLVNGHGAISQVAQMERLAAEFTERGPARVLYVYGLDASVGDDVGHATLTETAAVMALDESRVDLDQLPAGGPLRNIDWAIVDGETFRGSPTPDHTVRPEHDPRLATSQLGRKHLEATVNRIAPLIRQALASSSGEWRR